MDKVGFLENSNHEKSWSRVQNYVVLLYVLVSAAIESWSAGEVVPIEASHLKLVLGSYGLNCANKFLEQNKAKVEKIIDTVSVAKDIANNLRGKK